jgi:hypothetical protein
MPFNISIPVILNVAPEIHRVAVQDGPRISQLERMHKKWAARRHGIIAGRLLNDFAFRVEDENVFRVQAFFLHARGGHINFVARTDRNAATGSRSPAQRVKMAAEIANQFARFAITQRRRVVA